MYEIIGQVVVWASICLAVFIICLIVMDDAGDQIAAFWLSAAITIVWAIGSGITWIVL